MKHLAKRIFAHSLIIVSSILLVACAKPISGFGSGHTSVKVGNALRSAHLRGYALRSEKEIIQSALVSGILNVDEMERIEMGAIFYRMTLKEFSASVGELEKVYFLDIGANQLDAYVTKSFHPYGVNFAVFCNDRLIFTKGYGSLVEVPVDETDPFASDLAKYNRGNISAYATNIQDAATFAQVYSNSPDGPTVFNAAPSIQVRKFLLASPVFSSHPEIRRRFNDNSWATDPRNFIYQGLSFFDEELRRYDQLEGRRRDAWRVTERDPDTNELKGEYAVSINLRLGLNVDCKRGGPLEILNMPPNPAERPDMQDFWEWQKKAEALKDE